MIRKSTRWLPALAISVVLVSHAQAQNVPLRNLLDKLLADGEIVAAQAVVGRGDEFRLNCAIGATMPGARSPWMATQCFASVRAPSRLHQQS
ncbi:MAG: hypothetical protein P8J37_22570 [Fuerstiella sp.]|nr:hypothetical protein [Fuerstiella sp.]